jgi:hypothetical protein
MLNIDQTIKMLDPNDCIYMEATKNDNGNHKADPVFWLSPDVVMCDPASDPCAGNPCKGDPGFATQGVANLTHVTVHWKSNCQVPTGGEFQTIVYELYVGPASLLMTTGLTTGNTKDLTQSAKPVTGIAMGGSGQACFTWTPSVNAGDKDGPGHKCLIARCYPFGSNATFTKPDLSIYVVDDQHYAQHNLTIGVTGAPSPKKMQIQTGNAGEQRALVTIEVVQDLQPSATVVQAVMPSLQTIPGFKQIATAPVNHMSLDFSAFKNEDDDFDEEFEEFGHLIVDAITGLFGKKQQPNLEARLAILPKFFAAFTFTVDASGSNAGDAHLFHLTQKNQQGDFEGGLTVAVVTV